MLHPVEDDHRRHELHGVAEQGDGLADPVDGKALPDKGVDVPVALHGELDGAEVLELAFAFEHLDELLVVPLADLVDGALDGDVEDLLTREQGVDADAGEKGGLADAGAGRHEPELAGAWAGVPVALEEHPGRTPEGNHQIGHASSSSETLVRYFLRSSSDTSFGAGAYLENSIVNSALPWVADLRSVE